MTSLPPSFFSYVSRFFQREVFVAAVAMLVFCILLSNVRAGGMVLAKDGKVEITVVVPILPNANDTSTAARAEVAVVRQFEKDFPEIFRKKYLKKYLADPQKYGNYDWENVSVRLLPFTVLRVEGVENDLMSIAGGNPPDILYVNFRKSDTYIRNGFLYPLDKLDDGYFSALSEKEKNLRIHPKIWPVIERRGPDGHKHVWAMPYGGFLGRVLAYRKDLFDEAGISYPTADWTWDDMLEAAKKLTDPARGRVGLVMSGLGGSDVAWNFTTFLWSAGGEVMEYDESKDEWLCTFGSLEGAKALDYFLKLTMEPWTDAKGNRVRGYTETSSLGYARWDRGEVGMNLVYIDEQFTSGLNPDLIGLAPVPKGPSGLRAAELNSRMFGLFSGIPYPAVRDAAWEYMLYLDGEPARALRTRILVEGGMGRFVNPEDLKRFGYPEIVRLAPPGWAEVFDTAFKTGRPEPYGKNSNLSYRMLSIPVNEAVEMELSGTLPKDEEGRLAFLRLLLHRAEDKANERMMGKVSPEERRVRNGVAFAFLVGMAVAFGLVFMRIFRTFSGPAVLDRKKKDRRRIVVFLLLAPALVSILLWKYYPLLAGSIMGFQDYRFLGTSEWVGLKHFGDMLWDDMWWQALWNSARFSFLALVFGFLPPMLLAILLQEVPRGSLLYRLIFYLPAVLAGLVTLLLWKQFYEPSSRGALNAILIHIPAMGFLLAGGVVFVLVLLPAQRFWFHGQKVAAVLTGLIAVMSALGLVGVAEPVFHQYGWMGLWKTLPEPIQWLQDPRYAMAACIIPGIWAGMGPGCLIYLAALKGIPDDFYEAADIDGAGFLDKIISVVVPTLRPLIIINFVGAFIGSWMGSADTILAMTGGQANTEVAPLNIFYKAFVFLEFGPATAMAWMLGFLLIGFTVYQLRILAKVEFRAAGGKDS